MRFVLPALLLIAICAAAPGQPGTLGHAAESPLRSIGSSEGQVAIWLAAMIPISVSRDWGVAQAAFPGARWAARTSDTTPTVVRDGITYPGTLETRGYTDALEGDVALNGAAFRVAIFGTPERVMSIRLNASEGTNLNRPALRRALAARGVGWRLLRCDPLGDGRSQTIVALTIDGQSTVFLDSFSGDASAYEFHFDGGMYDPADPPGGCPQAELRDLQ